MRRAHNFVDKSGTRKGRLSILHVDPDKYGRRSVYYICQCDCGTLTSIHSSNLRPAGKVVSCGCYRAERSKQPRAPREEDRNTPEERGFQQVWDGYRKSARKRKFEFSLTQDEFRSLIKRDCEYCGESPANQINSSRKIRSHSYSAKLTYSGIDRRDNDVGYITENCAPCCMGCNYMKHTMSAEEFKARTLRIAAHWASK